MEDLNEKGKSHGLSIVTVYEISVEMASRTLKCSMAYGGSQRPLYKIWVLEIKFIDFRIQKGNRKIKMDKCLIKRL